MSSPIVESSVIDAPAFSGGSYSITMPSGIEVGDLLVIVAFRFNAGITTTMAGWTELLDDAAGRVSVYAKIAEGGDSASLSPSTGVFISYSAYRISGSDISGVEIANITSNSNAADPPNLVLAEGSADVLWLATASSTRDNSDITTYSSFPSGYSNTQTDVTPSGNGLVAGSAEKSNTAASENPGTFPHNPSISKVWMAATIGIIEVLPVGGDNALAMSNF